jgi:hypothetical protein
VYVFLCRVPTIDAQVGLYLPFSLSCLLSYQTCHPQMAAPIVKSLIAPPGTLQGVRNFKTRRERQPGGPLKVLQEVLIRLMSFAQRLPAMSNVRKLLQAAQLVIKLSIRRETARAPGRDIPGSDYPVRTKGSMSVRCAFQPVSSHLLLVDYITFKELQVDRASYRKIRDYSLHTAAEQWP